MVLEGIPSRLATYITQQVRIPTIGIGAGQGCDGQVLVIHDILGLYQKIQPKFVKQYANLADQITQAIRAYQEDVQSCQFPSSEHEFGISDSIWEAFVADINSSDQQQKPERP
jgi:3-methyl-2-oxobutanoate hydroxymethyltransferase